MKKLIGTSLIAIVFNISIIDNAYAYIDPGSGSLILQMLVASLLSAIFTIKMWWFSAKSFFLKLINPNNEPNKDCKSNEQQEKKED